MTTLRTLAASAISALCSLMTTAAAQTPAPVIDVHMHAPRPQDMSEWRSAMDELNVRHAVLIGSPSQLDAARSREQRFMPSLTMPCEGGQMPNIGLRCFEDGAEFPSIDFVRRLALEGRIVSLGEINAQYMGVAPGDPRLEPYYALAEELDLPIGIHLGIGPPGVAYADRPGFPPRKSPNYSGLAGSPLALERILIRHPRLRLYVMHAGWPMRDDMLYMLYMHPQLYVDVSVLQWAIPRAAYYSYLRDLVDAGFSDRIMFGSDGGVRHLRQGVAAINEAEFLTDEQRRAILYNNAAHFFRLAPAAP